LSRHDLVDWRDAMDAHCHHLNTLAELLKACGGELVEPEVVSAAGYWMSKEVRALKALLDELEGLR
jgi:hypothetical protein